VAWYDKLLPNENDDTFTAVAKGLGATVVGGTLGTVVGETADHYLDHAMRRRMNRQLVDYAVSNVNNFRNFNASQLDNRLTSDIWGRIKPTNSWQRIKDSLRGRRDGNIQSGNLPDWYSQIDKPGARRATGSQALNHARKHLSPADRRVILRTLRSARNYTSPAKAILTTVSIPTMLSTFLGGTVATTPYISPLLQKKKTIEEFAQNKTGDDKSIADQAKNFAAAQTGAAAVAIPSSLYGLGMMFNSGESRNLDRRTDTWSRLTQHSGNRRPIRHASMIERGISGYGPHFSPETRTVNMGILDDMGIMAHELGHAEQPWLQWRHRTNPLWKRLISAAAAGVTRVVPMKATGLSSLVSAFSDSEDASLASAAGASATYLPLLAEEIDASRRGANIIGRAIPKATLLQRLSTAKGLPTYMAAATIPFAAHYGRKYLGDGFEE
jgi:hypothetical protein